MDLSFSNTLSRRTDEMVTTRLPSWGEPILPEIWKLSEEEINAKFPLPMIPGETSSSIIRLLDDDDNDCPLLQMSDPYQEMDNDLASLMWQKGKPHLSTDLSATDVTSSSRTSDDMGDDDEDDNSMLFCRSDHSDAQREGIVDDQESQCSFEEDCWETNSDDMEVEQENYEMPLIETKSEPSIAWVIEAHYDSHQSLCFKLKISGGAYMLLLDTEVLDSVGALLEDAMENVLFKVQWVDGQLMLVEPSQVIAKVSEMIDNESRKRRLEVRDECEDTRHSGRKHPLRIPSLGGRCKARPEKPKCPTRFGSAWRALSGRGKIRPRQLARVE
jgi:hypothetical protein